MVSTNKKTCLLICILTGMAVIGSIIAISFGAKQIPLHVIYDSIFHYEDILDMQLVRDVRIPRVICTAIIGGILGISGAMMQGVTRNPIAEPSIMGISQGAMLAVAASNDLPGVLGVTGNMKAAFLGATVSGILVLLFSMKNVSNANLSKLLLAGTALSTFFTSIATIIALLTNQSQSLAFWVAGGFRSATWDSVKLAMVFGIVTMVLSLTLAGRINIVNLGEEVAVGLGENPAKVRMFTFLLIIPMCAVSVAVGGTIAFVGLIVPHMVRSIVGADYRKIMPISILAGATLLIWADVAARLINMPYETPIGLFTSMIGVPFFLFLVRKERS